MKSNYISWLLNHMECVIAGASRSKNCRIISDLTTTMLRFNIEADLDSQYRYCEKSRTYCYGETGQDCRVMK